VTFLPDDPGSFFQIRLRSTRTDAAAYCSFLLAHSPSAASILNPLGVSLQNRIMKKVVFFDEAKAINFLDSVIGFRLFGKKFF
jgi:hypothetical protein